MTALMLEPGYWSLDGFVWWPNASGNARQRRKERRRALAMAAVLSRVYGR